MKTEIPAFNELALSAPVLQALQKIGYEKPSAIQAKTIPLLLEGKDVLGQAQTGTGKTAAFALPALTMLDLENRATQVLVLAPTRELAIQVAEAFKTYASHVKGFHVLPVYGGQDYRVQTRALERGVHVIVGTPGRVMDHIRKKNIKLNELKMFILDEADEMLRMGFIDDVEWVLEQLPTERQMALFSATMPRQIARIAEKYLNKPEVVQIEVKTQTASTIRQRFVPAAGRAKLDALTRILEVEEFDAMIVFVRTKTSTVEISEKLEARGYASAPLNGDILQRQRERTIEQLKSGKLDIIVATDVAARGLDVSRISHVINYDITQDTESYVHRIGRTGRAGRKGDAILFVAPREKRMMQTIERATRQTIEQMVFPTTEALNKQRTEKFHQRITDTIDSEDLSFYEKLVEQYQTENESHTPVQVAAALARLLQGDSPFFAPIHEKRSERQHARDDNQRNDSRRNDRQGERSQGDKRARQSERPGRDRSGERDTKPRSSERPARDNVSREQTSRDHSDRKVRSEKPKTQSADSKPKVGMERYRLAVGQVHDVKAANIVGAIANEAGIDSQYIGSVKIHDDFSTIDLPEGMPKAIFKELKNVWVCGQKLQISKVNKTPREPSEFNAAPERDRKKKHGAKPGSKGPKRSQSADSGKKKRNKTAGPKADKRSKNKESS